MAWVYLFIAGIFEVFWATMMKLSENFTKLNYTIYMIIGMLISFYYLALSLKSIPLSTSYPIWSGIGAVGSILVGIAFFKDQIPLITWFFIACLLIGILGIKMTSGN